MMLPNRPILKKYKQIHRIFYYINHASLEVDIDIQTSMLLDCAYNFE